MACSERWRSRLHRQRGDGAVAPRDGDAERREVGAGAAGAAAGAQMAVLSGDPSKAVPFAVRLKFPANYAIPAHSHPGDENVTVTSGELFIGMGAKLDRQSATALAPGSYALMPAGMNHFAFTRSETTIVLFGTGPVDFKYVNPTDDPRTTN